MKLFHKIIGSGEPLVIMHGLFGMLDNWQTFAKSISEKGFEVHLLDMRNHGRSPHSEVFNYQAMADDLLEYFSDAHLDAAHVLGHSMGGKVAMVFATQNPEKVQSLMVIDIAPKAYPVHHQQILEGLNVLYRANLSSRKQAEELLSTVIRNKSIQFFLLKSLYWESSEKLALRFNLPVIEANIEMVGEELIGNAVYNKPTLFLRGGSSNYILDDDWDKILQHFPEALLKTIPGVGHWVHAEKPQAFYAIVSEFLLK